jgi:hypothetical protein
MPPDERAIPRILFLPPPNLFVPSGADVRRTSRRSQPNGVMGTIWEASIREAPETSTLHRVESMFGIAHYTDPLRGAAGVSLCVYVGNRLAYF